MNTSSKVTGKQPLCKADTSLIYKTWYFLSHCINPWYFLSIKFIFDLALANSRQTVLKLKMFAIKQQMQFNNQQTAFYKPNKRMPFIKKK